MAPSSVSAYLPNIRFVMTTISSACVSWNEVSGIFNDIRLSTRGWSVYSSNGVRTKKIFVEIFKNPLLRLTQPGITVLLNKVQSSDFWLVILAE